MSRGMNEEIKCSECHHDKHDYSCKIKDCKCFNDVSCVGCSGDCECFGA